MLEEVVVTARKREESLIDVPVAISAFTEASILEAGIDELGDVLDNTVGMVYNERDGNRSQAYPGVRGIKNFVGGGSARVSTFIDSMPVAGPQATIQFVDLAVTTSRLFRRYSMVWQRPIAISCRTVGIGSAGWTCATKTSSTWTGSRPDGYLLPPS